MLSSVKDYFSAKDFQQPKNKKKSTIIEYKVLPGETLFGISLSFDTNISNLKHLNGIYEDHIAAGQIIKIEIIEQDEINQDQIQTNSKDQSAMKTMTFRQQLLNIQFQLPMVYSTRNGDIEGIVQFSYHDIQFLPDKKKLKKTLIKNLKKKESQITNNILDEYNFQLKQREVYKIDCRVNEVIIFLWGVVGIEVPMYSEQDISLIQLSLKKSKHSVKALAKLKIELDISENIKLSQPEEIISYILQLIALDRLNITQDTLNKTLLPFLNTIVQPIQCESFITFYQIQGFQKVRDLSLEIYKKLQVEEEITPKLIPDNFDSIVKQKLMKNLISKLPQYLQHKDWQFVYSPSINGTSYDEFLRRTEVVDNHLIIVKDETQNIFGCFVTESWRISKNKFFGTGESFLFKIKEGELIVYNSTQKNQCYQMADDTGFSIGAGDRYGLWINHELLKGNTFPCETFANEMLSTQNDFTILDLEIWCFNEDWQKNRMMNQVKSSLLKQ